jgi:hypothetical protein
VASWRPSCTNPQSEFTTGKNVKGTRLAKTHLNRRETCFAVDGGRVGTRTADLSADAVEPMTTTLRRIKRGKLDSLRCVCNERPRPEFLAEVIAMRGWSRMKLWVVLYPGFECRNCIRDRRYGCYCSYAGCTAPGEGPDDWVVYLRCLFMGERT